jgi:tetratricopeptide (TPR) repeat protein
MLSNQFCIGSFYSRALARAKYFIARAPLGSYTIPVKMLLRRSLHSFLLAALLVCACSPVSADFVRLKNGKTFEGTITEEDETQVSLQMEIGFMRFKRSRVSWVIRGERAEIERKARAGNYYLEGTDKAKKGMTEKAAPLLEKALALEPDNLEIRANLAYAYAYSGRPQEAAQLYRETVAADPKNRELRMNLASAYVNSKDYKKAAETLHRMLRDHPDDAEILQKLCLVFHKAGIYTQSVRYAKKAAKLLG